MAVVKAKIGAGIPIPSLLVTRPSNLAILLFVPTPSITQAQFCTPVALKR
jgi:hypothetical protein